MEMLKDKKIKPADIISQWEHKGKEVKPTNPRKPKNKSIVKIENN